MVVSALTIIMITSVLVSYKANERRVVNMELHQTFDVELFTHQEMDYIKHGDTQLPLLDRHDQRYLKFLRSHLTKQDKRRNKPSASHLVCSTITFKRIIMPPQTSFIALARMQHLLHTSFCIAAGDACATVPIQNH